MADAMHGTCWAEDRAHAVLRSVALANDEAEFLAVHQPIRDFQVSTTTGRSIESTDEALLADLSDPENRYAFCVVEGEPRSEEHTSELQSLMRISYAVFCL